MARITTNHGKDRGSLTDEQWSDLMRSLIEDTDQPMDEESDNTYLQEVAARDDAKPSSQQS